MKPKEQHIYGSSRLGMKNCDREMIGAQAVSDIGTFSLVRGEKSYELSNHLGNVLEVITDQKFAISDGGSGIDHFLAEVISYSDYSPFGAPMDNGSASTDRNWQGDYRYGFNGMEHEPLVNTGEYDFGARMYDGRLGRWLSVDPIFTNYIPLSTYCFTANNAILYIELNGAVFDLGNLSDEEKHRYNEAIKALSASKLFEYYYGVLTNSTSVYFISTEDLGVGGQFNPNNMTVDINNIDNYSILSQELFHAFQKELGIYESEDHSVIEAEGDIMTQYVANEAIIITGGMIYDQSVEGGWAEEILNINGDVFSNPTNEQVQSSDYENKFKSSVDRRIEYFKTQGEGFEPYTTPNSGKGSEAIRQVFENVYGKEMEKSEKK